MGKHVGLWRVRVSHARPRCVMRQLVRLGGTNVHRRRPEILLRTRPVLASDLIKTRHTGHSDCSLSRLVAWPSASPSITSRATIAVDVQEGIVVRDAVNGRCQVGDCTAIARASSNSICSIQSEIFTSFGPTNTQRTTVDFRVPSVLKLRLALYLECCVVFMNSVSVASNDAGATTSIAKIVELVTKLRSAVAT